MEWADATFDASHIGKYADQMHGHTWFVRAFWPAEPETDARTVRAQLVSVLDQWDHTVLDGKVDPTNYGVAKAVAERIQIVTAVAVWRGGRVPCGAIYRKDGSDDLASNGDAFLIGYCAGGGGA